MKFANLPKVLRDKELHVGNINVHSDDDNQYNIHFIHLVKQSLKISLKKLFAETSEVYKRLKSLDLYKDIDIHIGLCIFYKKYRNIVPIKSSSIDNVHVNFLLKHYPLYTLGISKAPASDGKYRSSAYLKIRSLFGLNERIKFEYNTDIQHKNPKYGAQLLLNPFGDLQLLKITALHSEHNLSKSSSILAHENGIYLSFEPNLKHILTVSSALRDSIPAHRIFHNNYKISAEMLQELRPSIKNSVTYQFKSNWISNYTESKVKYILEYAGFNGDVNYIKQLLYYKGIIPIENSKNGALITIGFNGGIIYPLKYNYLSNNESNINYIHLSDKLKIDTNYIYGFSSTGLGPRAQIQHGQSHGDFLGGDILYSGNVSLLFPLPNDIDIRFYVSAGNLFNWTSKDKNIFDLSSSVVKLRGTVGVGITFPVTLPVFNSVFYCDINYNHYIKHRHYDHIQRIQVSFK